MARAGTEYLSIYVDDHIKHLIKSLAKRNKRTISSETNYRILKGLENDGLIDSEGNVIIAEKSA